MNIASVLLYNTAFTKPSTLCVSSDYVHFIREGSLEKTVCKAVKLGGKVVKSGFVVTLSSCPFHFGSFCYKTLSLKGISSHPKFTLNGQLNFTHPSYHSFRCFS